MCHPLAEASSWASNGGLSSDPPQPLQLQGMVESLKSTQTSHSKRSRNSSSKSKDVSMTKTLTYEEMHFVGGFGPLKHVQRQLELIKVVGSHL